MEGRGDELERETEMANPESSVQRSMLRRFWYGISDAPIKTHNILLLLLCIILPN